MNPRSALLAAISLLVTSLGCALAFLAVNDWFGAGDVQAFIFWSLPLAAIIYLSFRKLPARLARASSRWQYPMLAIIGGTAGMSWTIIVALLLGGWIAAFSFPVLLCWIAGGVFAGIAAAWHSHPGSWPVALASSILMSASVASVGEYLLRPEPHIRVVLAPESTPDDEIRFWREVVGTPGSTPTAHSLIEGISGVGIVDYEAGRPVFDVRLRKGISRERRDSIVSRIRSSPMVARIDTL